MTKLTLIFIAVFLIFQLVSSAELREKRDVETTTSNIFDSIKSNIENTFSEQNIRKAVDTLNDVGDKLKDLGSKVVTNFQSAMKPETTEKP